MLLLISLLIGSVVLLYRIAASALRGSNAILLDCLSQLHVAGSIIEKKNVNNDPHFSLTFAQY